MVLGTKVWIFGSVPCVFLIHGTRTNLQKTNEYTIYRINKRVIKEGTKRGFAVAAIDAFYKKPVKANEKTRFPDFVFKRVAR